MQKKVAFGNSSRLSLIKPKKHSSQSLDFAVHLCPPSLILSLFPLLSVHYSPSLCPPPLWTSSLFPSVCQLDRTAQSLINYVCVHSTPHHHGLDLKVNTSAFIFLSSPLPGSQRWHSLWLALFLFSLIPQTTRDHGFSQLNPASPLAPTCSSFFLTPYSDHSPTSSLTPTQSATHQVPNQKASTVLSLTMTNIDSTISLYPTTTFSILMLWGLFFKTSTTSVKVKGII